MLPAMSRLGVMLSQRLPIIQWLPKYTSEDAVCDVIAGITVGLTLMPQAIAYAGLAGLGAQVKNNSSSYGRDNFKHIG
ncbi:hypothetical protein J6590_071766 [Homalodisca vitripennis]|nr:hypothetical protein J6590_071766 [Homalodisca vitripennis]